MDALVSLHTSLYALQVKSLWSNANWAYDDAARHAAEAQKLARQDQASQTAVQHDSPLTSTSLAALPLLRL